ncbi:LysR family transcriptional regulator [Brucellaceae bacterium VT-16-1752]|nr:LysR family transcriptional regulator [Brucellaceae bacterium VT-16-1752]
MPDEEVPRTGLPIEDFEDIADLNCRPLKYVLVAAHAMSIRRAAEMLEVEPSSVSRAIRNFEDRIGVALFERGSFGVRLTDAGREFVEQTVPAVQQIYRAIQHAGAAGRVETGVLRVGVITTLAGGFLRELVEKYEAAYPGVRVDIRDGARQDHIHNIRTHTLDVAFFTGNGDVAGCDTLELWRERVHIAMPRSHRLSDRRQIDWPELRDELFIVSRREPGTEVRAYIVRRIADYSTYPLIESCAAHQETLMHMVALGKGITPVSEAWTDMNIRDLKLVPLSAAADIVPFSAVWSPKNDNPSRRRLISFAHDLAKKSDTDRK